MAGPLGIREEHIRDEEQRSTLRYIEDFDLGDELDSAEEKGYLKKGERRAVETELKRYLAVFHLLDEEQIREEGPLSPSEKLDPIWHLFILNTRAYHDFCYRVYQEYRHHVPSETGDRGEPLVNAGEVVQRYFEDVDEAVWEGDPIRCFNGPKKGPKRR